MLEQYRNIAYTPIIIIIIIYTDLCVSFLLGSKRLWSEEKALIIVGFPSKLGLCCPRKRFLHVTLMRVNMRVLWKGKGDLLTLSGVSASSSQREKLVPTRVAHPLASVPEGIRKKKEVEDKCHQSCEWNSVQKKLWPKPKWNQLEMVMVIFSKSQEFEERLF